MIFVVCKVTEGILHFTSCTVQNESLYAAKFAVRDELYGIISAIYPGKYHT